VRCIFPHHGRFLMKKGI